jgi:hypothetical protein
MHAAIAARSVSAVMGMRAFSRVPEVSRFTTVSSMSIARYRSAWITSA